MRKILEFDIGLPNKYQLKYVIAWWKGLIWLYKYSLGTAELFLY